MSVRVERQGPVATIILHRPHSRNAVDRPTAEALAATVREVDEDKDISVGVLFGDGGTFCAGADLSSIGTERQNRVDWLGDGPMGPSRMSTTKPFIAALSGYAVAGGLELALWCDLRVAEESSVLGVFCRRFGVPLIDGGTVRLPRLIGLSRALDLILTGRAVQAQEAYAMGLVNRVVPNGQARMAAEALAIELSKFPQICLRADRASAYEAFDGTIEQAMERELERGLKALLKEGQVGAERFRAGTGRHGAF